MEKGANRLHNEGDSPRYQAGDRIEGGGGDGHSVGPPPLFLGCDHLLPSAMVVPQAEKERISSDPEAQAAWSMPWVRPGVWSGSPETSRRDSYK